MDGLLDSEWEKYLPSNLPESAFSDLSKTIKYQPLNVKKLIDAGVIRITQPGSGTGPEPKINNDPENWSMVTMYNDQYPNSYTKNWPTKPESFESAIKHLNDPGALYDGKYRQVLWSAMKAGLKPDDIFLKKRIGFGLLD